MKKGSATTTILTVAGIGTTIGIAAGGLFLSSLTTTQEQVVDNREDIGRVAEVAAVNNSKIENIEDDIIEIKTDVKTLLNHFNIKNERIINPTE